MFFFLTKEALKRCNSQLDLIDSPDVAFDEQVVDNKVLAADCQYYAEKIDNKSDITQEELLTLSRDCKTAIYIQHFGETDVCFNLNDCSLSAINVIIGDNYNRDVAVMLNSPVYISNIGPDVQADIGYVGLSCSTFVDDLYTLFKVGYLDTFRLMQRKYGYKTGADELVPIRAYTRKPQAINLTQEQQERLDELHLLANSFNFSEHENCNCRLVIMNEKEYPPEAALVLLADIDTDYSLELIKKALYILVTGPGTLESDYEVD